jgi:hypothetical protein
VGSLNKDGVPNVGGVNGMPYHGGCDISFGTAERGITIVSLFGASYKTQVLPVPSHWRHIVIVIRGVASLEVALRTDKNLIPGDVTEAKDVFD